MSPEGMLGMPMAGAMQQKQAAAPNLYNQVSSMGAQQPAEQTEQQPVGESLVDVATKRFGAVFDMFRKLTESYPGSDKESQLVMDSMSNWLNSTINRINESGGTSNY